MLIFIPFRFEKSFMNLPETQRTTAQPRRNWRMGALMAILVAFLLFLLALVLTGQVWRAAAYGMVALFAFLFGLAAYFWGSLVFGSTLEMLSQSKRKPVPWKIGSGEALNVPKHDIDPGLELLGAGMLVYRIGEVKPQPAFRHVPLDNVRALRPFIVARTGVEQTHHFTFKLHDEHEGPQFSDTFDFALQDQPRVVMPPYRLTLADAARLVGRRWTLRVQSGMTVVTTFRFRFTAGAAQDVLARDTAANTLGDGQTGDAPQIALSELLDEVVKLDAMMHTEDVGLEDM